MFGYFQEQSSCSYLQTFITLGWKGLSGPNTLAYLDYYETFFPQN
jgi:hypothetical protein